MSTARSFTLPPLAIHTQPKQRISLLPDLSTANLSEIKLPQPNETRRPDRDALPSMLKAATAHESSNLKMVSFAPEDGNESESSSICHSPTWDDYGKKKRKEPDAKRKRLTKEPPPAAMDNRPYMTARSTTDSTLSIQQLRQCLESGSSSQQFTSVPSEVSIPLPVESVETVARSPGFIGGVRLEREREAAKQRMMNSRASSVERPVSEMMLQSPPLQSESKTDLAKKRETAPAVSYPPQSSKAYFLTDSRPTRTRRNSIGQGLKIAAGRLFSGKDKDSKNEQSYGKRSDSRASVDTVQTLYGASEDRGRQMSGSTVTHSRHQSYDRHERSISQQNEERRGAVSLPPAAWKNKQNKARTISMMAVPPDSARDGSFSPFHSPPLEEDNFCFLERPFSPPTEPPMSPPGSMSPSLKAKMSPAITPISAASPVWQPPAKKTFKEALRAGFRSSSSTPDAARRRSGTLDTLVGTEIEIPLPGRDGLPLQSPPVAAAAGSPALSARGARQSGEQHIGQAQSGVDSKDSAASSSSSHHDSESQVPSPMTTPEGSRPQSSSKDSQAFRLDEVKRIPPLSYENVIAMRGAKALPASGYPVPKKTQSPRVSVEQPRGSPKAALGQHRRSSSKAAEELAANQSFLTDELWSQPRKPLDPDQLSFTSAVTSIDVKKPFVDLDSALQSPNGDVTPLSLEPPSKAMTTTQKDTPPSSRGSHTSLPPSSPLSTRSSRVNGYPVLGHGVLPTGKADKASSSSQASMSSPNLRKQPSRKASDYLQEARKAAPASPRAPASNTSSQPPLPTANNTNSGVRAFALSKPQTASAAASVPAIFSPLSSQPVKRSSTQSPTPLGAPISKMLVECCHCKFYQDMPSRVYEAMARPDDVVKDKRLGVSGQVTTCVKCPWCAHNMSTMCCAGYAAIVYLQEKLHGP